MELNSEEWVRIKQLFQSALELQPGARQEFLLRNDLPEELRTFAEELIQAHEEAGSFLDHNAFSREDRAATGAPPGQSRFTSGGLLAGRFRILRFLAKGGMGEVYEAEDLELRARVAIKTIRPEIAYVPHALERFKREVHLAKQVTHPNVCRIFDLFRHCGDDGNDVLFISMELLRGETLLQRLKTRGRMEPVEVLFILRQILPALGAAHTAGILHRDLKPANIVLEPVRDGSTRVVITDFGLAWSLDSNSDTPLTRSGQFAFGTPEYMSPEQIEGKELTPASDLYSLGLVVYQMLTDIAAFRSEAPIFSALRRLTEDPPVPSRTVPGLDPQWDALVSRCLNRNPAQRFVTAQQLSAMLDSRADGLVHVSKSLHKYRRPVKARQARFNRRLKLALYSLAASVALAGAVPVYLHLHRRKRRGAEDISVVLADFVNITGEPVFDNTLNVALSAKLQQSPFFNLMPDAKSRLALRYMGLSANKRLTRHVARQVCLREGGQVVLQGTIAPGDKGYDLWLRAFDCSSGNQIADTEVPAEVRESTLTALDQAADTVRGQLGESVESLQKYDVVLEDASTPSLEALTAYSQGLRLSNEQGQVAAEPYFRQAVEIDPDFAIAYARLSSIYADMGEPQRAREAATQAYELRDRTSEWERFFILSSYYAFATGELNKEMQTYEEWGKVYPHDTVWPTGLAIDYSYFGRLEKAAEMERLQISNAPETAAAYGNLAQIYLALERPDEAQATLDQAAQAHLHEININWDLYFLAFYRNDTAGMNAVLDHASVYPGLEETLLEEQSKTEAYYGHLRASRQVAQKASRVAASAGETETAAVWQAQEALWEAEFGNTQTAHADALQALTAYGASKTVQMVGAFALASAGDEPKAESLVNDLQHAYPLDTMLNQYWLPVIRARVALHQHNPALAGKLLDSAIPYETGLFDPLPCMYSVYLQGLTHLSAGQGVQASADFRKVLAHRGLVLNCPTGALSQLGLARSLALVHDTEGSRLAYQNLFALWKDTDPGLSLPQVAKAEYRALQ